ncbi:ribose-phosphate pyrophosphokinase [Patescibacteria group bacterium]|nr:ribose-phosphate pyrophosphokinase [Patescibacteria group bacterium]MCG2701848.1 ribose-phosphate pyrophosphokinase [Candidatus Parcubacteria bacterium]MBU4265400.1 ribose-phosphate pyrophosphokinase [Patescibacteria group bacterium]MBU4390352.1 ribose-phosphate pyrophosphokinase [Patescibacteria group bacterium]MBU4396598.1 ribose-phosphate pyrophosphokinase [Patescibacteria group bacterium]
MRKLQLISGRSHPVLAKKVARLVKIPLSPVEIKNFASGEIYVRVGKKVRGNDVFVIQSLVSPVNDNLMELLILVDALKRASAGRINLICPFICYSRQDRKADSREPITAKLVANLISKAGADRLLTIDLHADQIQGFYDIPVDHFVGYPLFAKYLKKKRYKDMVVVSPDIGGLKRANKMADLLGLPIAVIDKIRKKHNCAEVAHVVGEVKGKIAVIIDDIIDTGGSIVVAAEVLKERGAKKIIVCATHGLLSGKASENLQKSCVDKVLFLDSVPISKEKRFAKMEILSIASLLAKIIKRIHTGQSLGVLFKWEKKGRRL